MPTAPSLTVYCDIQPFPEYVRQPVSAAAEPSPMRQENYDTQRRWLLSAYSDWCKTSPVRQAAHTGEVAVRTKALATYRECTLVVANDRITFSTGLSLNLTDVNEVQADLRYYEFRLATAQQGVVRVRALNAEAMQRWMCVLRPTSYRNATHKDATAPIPEPRVLSPLSRAGQIGLRV
jgi:hypothetical protein